MTQRGDMINIENIEEYIKCKQMSAATLPLAWWPSVVFPQLKAIDPLFPSRLSKQSSREGRSLEEPELPRELTEDWATMEVCVDCKKFITEIISSSRRSLSVATKRARLNRKTQSFYLSSAKSTDFRPAERTINEV